MSYQRALEAINLRRTDGIPQIEHISHPEFIKKITGKTDWNSSWEALAEVYRPLDLDFAIYTEEGYIPEWERMSQSKDTSWGLETTSWRTAYRCKEIEDVYLYDPWKDQEEKSIQELVTGFNSNWSKIQSLFGDVALVAGGLYRTLFMWPLMTFGWELFLEAAMNSPEKFKRIIDGFAEIAMRDISAWSKVPIKVFASHDDLAMARGPIFNPDWYRKYIFPWYKKIWEPLRANGIKILFISDGDIEFLLEDIWEAGADGVVIEPAINLKGLVGKKGRDKIIIGNIDTKTLRFGTLAKIEDEIKRCIEDAGNCPGYFLNVSGGLPQDIPLSNVDAYFDICARYKSRIK